ncbi:hypothetical protein LDENG_00238000 [Lucifuga dentata]|nr:hypothetical protein LDENG_00238000 [Lucifuga dentata]
MLQSVESLKKKTKRGMAAESGALQQLFLLVGMHLFKAPEELLDIMKDLQSCVDRAQDKKAKKKKKKKQQDEQQEEEPEWVEVMVDILLSLLSQPSRLIRQVCKTVFSSICPHVTAAALNAILDVLDPDRDEEESAVVVTDDSDSSKSQKKPKEDDDDEQDEEMEDDKSDGADDESDEDDDDEAMEEEEEGEDEDEGEEEEEEEEEEVDQNFRLELMKVLKHQNALATEEDGSSDEDLDDDAMMKLDKSLSALFSEQKKKTQAKKEEKTKLHKEKMLLRDFKIKVLDLVEVFVARQAGSPLVLGLVEPVLTIIDRGMSADSEQQEQDFLRRAADIFRNQLCRSKAYCRTADDRQEELHLLLEKLMTKSQKLSDSSVCLYYFSACLYLLKVLRGAPPAATKQEQTAAGAAEDLSFMGNLDVDRVSNVFREALSSFLSRRRSPLTTQMFTDLFTRFPVVCVQLLDTAVQHITSGVREHQQAQACVLVLRALQSREVQQLLRGAAWAELCEKVTGQLTASLKLDAQKDSKAVKEKLVKALELCHFLLKLMKQQGVAVGAELQQQLQALSSMVGFKTSGRLEDTYWNLMKHFGVTKPKAEKTKSDPGAEQPRAPKKKKGFLPETKKRNKQKKKSSAAETSTSTDKPAAKKRNNKKTKRKQPDAASQAGLAKKSRTPSESKTKKKKLRKRQREGKKAAE